MFAIYKKELKQYFHSMIGFVFMLEEASRPLDIELDGFALSPAPENEVEPRPRNTVRPSKQRKKPYSQER